MFNVLFYMLLCTQIIDHFKNTGKFVSKIDLRWVEEQTTEGGGQIRNLPHLCEEQSVSSRKTEKQRKKLVRGKTDRNCKCKKGKNQSPIFKARRRGD